MTTDQLALLEVHEILLPTHDRAATIEQRWRAFHELNPWIYDAMVTLTRRYVAGGARRVSAKMLVEVIRFEYGATRGDDAYKIDNSFTALYARQLLADHPEWDGLIELRTRRSEQVLSSAPCDVVQMDESR